MSQKHFIISEEQAEELIGEIGCHPLMRSLPELKRLSDQEIALAWLAIKDPIALGSKFATPDEVREFAHAIMDKLGVPK